MPVAVGDRRDAEAAAGALGVVALAVVLGLVHWSSDLLFVALGLLVLAVVTISLVSQRVALFVIVALVFSRAGAVATEYGVPELLAPFALTIGLLVLLSSKRPRARELPTFTVALLAYFVVLLGGLLFADNIGATGTALRFDAQIVGIAFGVVALVRSARALRVAIWAILIAGFVIAGIGIYQFLSGSFGNSYLGFGRANLANIVGETNSFRIGGPFGDPNFFAQMLIVIAALAVERFVRSRTLAPRLLALVIGVTAVVATLFTFSRGGIVALAVVAVLTATSLRLRPGAIIPAVVLAAFLFWQFAPPSYNQRFSELAQIIPGVSQTNQISDPALAGRSSEWRAGIGMFVDNPIVGVGAGNFSEHYLDYARDIGLDLRGQGRNAHNLLIQIGAETGILGLAAFGYIVFGAFRRVRRTARALRLTGDEDTLGLVLGLRNAMIGFAVTSLFLHAAYPDVLWLLLALAWATPQIIDVSVERNRVSESV